MAGSAVATCSGAAQRAARRMRGRLALGTPARAAAQGASYCMTQAAVVRAALAVVRAPPARARAGQRRRRFRTCPGTPGHNLAAARAGVMVRA